jgi:hypothetical protein
MFESVRTAMTSRHLEADQWLNKKEWRLGSGRRRQLSQGQKERHMFHADLLDIKQKILHSRRILLLNLMTVFT